MLNFLFRRCNLWGSAGDSMCWAVEWIFEAEDVEQWEERFAISGCLSGLKGGALVIVGGVPSSTVQDGINLTLAGLPCPALPISGSGLRALVLAWGVVFALMQGRAGA